MFEGIGAVPYDPGLTGRTGAIVNFGNGLLNGVDLADRFQQRRDAKADRAMQLEDRTQQMGLAAEDRRYTMEERQRKRAREDQADQIASEMHPLELDMRRAQVTISKNNLAQADYERWRAQNMAETEGYSLILDAIEDPTTPEPIRQASIARAQGVFGEKTPTIVQSLQAMPPDDRAKLRRKIAIGTGQLKEPDLTKVADTLKSNFTEAHKMYLASTGPDRVRLAAQLDDIEEQIAQFVKMHKEAPVYGEALASYDVDPDAISWAADAAAEVSGQADVTMQDNKNSMLWPGWKGKAKYQQAEQMKQTVQPYMGIGGGANMPKATARQPGPAQGVRLQDPATGEIGVVRADAVDKYLKLGYKIVQ